MATATTGLINLAPTTAKTAASQAALSDYQKMVSAGNFQGAYNYARDNGWGDQAIADYNKGIYGASTYSADELAANFGSKYKPASDVGSVSNPNLNTTTGLIQNQNGKLLPNLSTNQSVTYNADGTPNFTPQSFDFSGIAGSPTLVDQNQFALDPNARQIDGQGLINSANLGTNFQIDPNAIKDITGNFRTDVNTDISSHLQKAPDAVGYNAKATEVTPDALVRNQMQKVMAEDSPLLQMGRTRALQDMNGRGILNSSMAMQASDAAVLEKALQIATPDAATYYDAIKTTANAVNDASRFLADSQNKVGMFNSQQAFDARKAEVELGLKQAQDNIDREIKVAQSNQDKNLEIALQNSRAVLQDNQMRLNSLTDIARSNQAAATQVDIANQNTTRSIAETNANATNAINQTLTQLEGNATLQSLGNQMQTWRDRIASDKEFAKLASGIAGDAATQINNALISGKATPEMVKSIQIAANNQMNFLIPAYGVDKLDGFKASEWQIYDVQP